MKNLDKFKNFLNTLSARERNLILITIATFIFVIIYYVITFAVGSLTASSSDYKAKVELVEQVAQLAKRHRNLDTKLKELTTKYLNSSLTFEQLTNHLDKLAKAQLGSETYELIPSRDKSEVGSDFIGQKFTIKVRKCTYEQVLNLLKALEVGPPPVFLQKVDIVKSSDGKSVSIVIDIVSVKKNS